MRRSILNALAMSVIAAGSALMLAPKPAKADVNPPYCCKGPTCNCCGNSFAHCDSGGCDCV